MNLINPYIFGNPSPFTFFVSQSGNDANDGLTIPTAWKTGGHAQTVVQGLLPTQIGNISVTFLDLLTITPGDEMILTSSDSGQNGFTVSWQNQAGLGSSVTGGFSAAQMPATSWTNVSGNLWSAAYTGISARAIWVNGRRADRSRRGSGLVSPTLQTNGYIVVADPILTDPNSTAVELVYAGNYQMPQNIVDNVNSGTSSINMTQPAHTYITDTPGVSLISPLPSDVVNCKDDFDNNAQPGTFYIDSAASTIYYYPRFGEDMTTAEVLVPNGVETLWSMTGVDSVNITGLAFLYSHFDMTGQGYAERYGGMGYNSTFTYSASDDGQPSMGFLAPAAVYMSGCTNCMFSEGNRAIYCSGMALHITLDCDSIQVIGNSLGDTSGTTMAIGDPAEALNLTCSSNLTIENNYLFEGGREFKGACGMMGPMYTTTFFRQNFIVDYYYAGLANMMGGGVSTTWTDKVASNRHDNNIIQNVCRELIDGGSFHTNNDQHGSTYNGNWFINANPLSVASLKVANIYLDAWTDNVTVQNNVCQYAQVFAVFNELQMGNAVVIGANLADQNTVVYGGSAIHPGTNTAPTVTANPSQGSGAAVVAAAGLQAPYAAALLPSGPFGVPSVYPGWWIESEFIAANSGDSIPQIVDQSFSGANLDANTSGRMGTYIPNVQNGYPAVRFNGTTNLNITPISIVNTLSDFTLFLVFVPKSTTMRVLAEQVGAAGGEPSFEGGGGSTLAARFYVDSTTPATGPASLTNGLACVVTLSATGGVTTYELNGVAGTTGTNAAPTSADRMTIGGRFFSATDSQFTQMDFIGGLAYFPGVTAPNRATITAALIAKYAISAPSADALLLESSDNILIETGDLLLLE